MKNLNSAFSEAHAINPLGKPVEADFTGTRLFIPISLDNHYYSRQRVTDIIEKCAAQATDTIWVLCDRLKLYNYCGKDGKPSDLSDGDLQTLYGEIVDKKFSDAKRMIEKCYERYPQLKCDVRNFDPVMLDENYHRLVQAIETLAASDSAVNTFINDAVNRKTIEIYGADSVTATQEWQRRYVIEETVLSLMHTELYGHNFELYRHECNGLVDYLERDHSEWLKQTLGMDELSRVFVPLEPIVGKSNPKPADKDRIRPSVDTSEVPVEFEILFSPLRPYCDPESLEDAIRRYVPDPKHQSVLLAGIG